MVETAEEFTVAQRIAQRFLRRWSDPFTRGMSEDLAQDAAVQSWLGYHAVHDPDRFPGFVRTIARRLRARFLDVAYKTTCASLDQDNGLLETAGLEVSARDTGGGTVELPVAGCAVGVPTLLRDLDSMLEHLTALNRCLLTGYYEGFSCAELGERYGMSSTMVKVRLHRSRARLRSGFEARVDEATGRYFRGRGAREFETHDKGARTCNATGP